MQPASYCAHAICSGEGSRVCWARPGGGQSCSCQGKQFTPVWAIGKAAKSVERFYATASAESGDPPIRPMNTALIGSMFMIAGQVVNPARAKLQFSSNSGKCHMRRQQRACPRDVRRPEDVEGGRTGWRGASSGHSLEGEGGAMW